MAKVNANPVIYERRAARYRPTLGEGDGPDAQEIFELVRDIRDPEHPYSLEQLDVLCESGIEVNKEKNSIRVMFTPTVQHCSMATLIGLCIRVKLMQSLPSKFKVDIRVAPGSHSTEDTVNKQLNDKERVVAAMENPYLSQTVQDCIAPSEDLDY